MWSERASQMKEKTQCRTTVGRINIAPYSKRFVQNPFPPKYKVEPREDICFCSFIFPSALQHCFWGMGWKLVSFGDGAIFILPTVLCTAMTTLSPSSWRHCSQVFLPCFLFAARLSPKLHVSVDGQTVDVTPYSIATSLYKRC